MDALLQHLVKITGHRDHSLLDISVVSALHQLTGLHQVRLLEILPHRGELFLREKVWIKEGKAVSAEDELNSSQVKDPLSNYPVLMNCIEQHKNCAEQIAADGQFILWLPIWLNDKAIACLEIINPKRYTTRMFGVIDGVLQVYRNFQNLLDYSERDSLTGLLNRKTFDENFARVAFSMAPGENKSLPDDDERRHNADVKAQWLAVVDIDHFKKVNDVYGHLYGDEVLILVANLLRTSFRSHDRIFRFGGEEFVILLRSTTFENARKIFERFREKVEQHHFPQVGKITISLGFVSISNDTPVVILGHADQALYYAKSNGRNQICFYDELVSTGVLQSEVSNNSVEFF